MTPSEREAAKRALGQCVRSACAGAYAREVSSYLRRALDQIDADERLMKRVLESHDHFPHGVGAATDALRTRLGQENDAEPEKPEKVEAAVAAMPRAEPEFQVGQWAEHEWGERGRVVDLLDGTRLEIRLSNRSHFASYTAGFTPCSPVCTAEQRSIGVGDKVRVDDVPVDAQGLPYDSDFAGRTGEIIEVHGRWNVGLQTSWGTKILSRWNIASIIECGPNGPGG